jgi:hypothetical protein
VGVTGITSTTIVKRQTGSVDTVVFPNTSYELTAPKPGGLPLQVVTVHSEEYDIFAADIGALWDTGEPTPRCLFAMGDIYGTAYHGQGAFDSPPAANRTVLAGLATFDITQIASSSTGRNAGQLPLDDTLNLPDSGYMSVQVAGGIAPGDFAVIYYGSVNRQSITVGGVTGKTVAGCVWIAGTGTTVPTAAAKVGDPRFGGGFRGNALASSTDTTLSSGFLIDSWYDRGDHTAKEVWPFGCLNTANAPTGPTRQTANSAMVFPSAGPTLPLDAADIRGNWFTNPNGSIGSTLTMDVTWPSSIPHGFTNNVVRFSGPRVEFDFSGNTTFSQIGTLAAAATANSGFTVTSLPASITVTKQNIIPAGGGLTQTTAPFVPSSGTATQKRIVCDTSTGFAVIGYTSLTATGTTNTFSGLTLIAGTGTVSAGGWLWQGIVNESPAFNLPTSPFASAFVAPAKPIINIFDINPGFGAPANTIRFFGGYTVSAGGDYTNGLLRKPQAIYAPAASSTLAASSDQQASDAYILSGACAVPLDTAAGEQLDSVYASSAGKSGTRKQVAFVQQSTYQGAFPNYIATWVSLDGGDNWTRQNGLNGTAQGDWTNDSLYDSRVQQISPYYDEVDAAGAGTAYVYSISTPGLVLMRCIPSQIHKRSAWQFWNGTAWGSTIPSGGTGRIWSDSAFGTSDAPFNTVNLTYSSYFASWIAIYSGFQTIEMRTATNITGPWSDKTTVCVVNDNFIDFPKGTTGTGTLETVTPKQNLVYGGWIHPWSGKFANNPRDLFCTITLYNTYQVFLLKISLSGPARVQAFARADW